MKAVVGMPLTLVVVSMMKTSTVCVEWGMLKDGTGVIVTEKI
jgi:hypothetical protein